LDGVSGDGRHLGSGKRACHKAPAEPILAAFEPQREIATTRLAPTSKKEATGVPETVTAIAIEGTQRPRAALARPSK
jgi:hypothetical protein